MANSEYHVASFIVQTLPEHMDEVAATINAVEGLEVHGAENGKLIVTAEGDHVRVLADRAQELQTARHVLAVAPIYHEFSNDQETRSSTGAGLQ